MTDAGRMRLFAFLDGPETLDVAINYEVNPSSNASAVIFIVTATGQRSDSLYVLGCKVLNRGERDKIHIALPEEALVNVGVEMEHIP